LEFGATFFHDIAIHGVIYLRDWVAIYGFGATRVPPVIYPLFGLLLVVAWLSSPSPRAINARVRAVLILTTLIGCFCMFMVIYLTFNPIGATSIVNLQGRHFTPLLPVLILGLVPGRKFFPRLADWVVPVAVGVGTLLTLAIYILGAYLSYYVVCGTSLYTPGLCYQPQYKNWAPNAQSTQPVTQDVLLQQTFKPVCTSLRLVRVWSSRASPEPSGETLITLKDAESGAVVAEERVNNLDATDHTWLEMAFPPVDRAVGRQFLIEIKSDLSNSSAGLSFGVTARREYLYGLVINNVPTDYDLIFQYGCEPLKLIDVINKVKNKFVLMIAGYGQTTINFYKSNFISSLLKAGMEVNMFVETAIHDRPIVSKTIDTPGGWIIKGIYSPPLTSIGDWPTHERFCKSGAGRVAETSDKVRVLVDFYLQNPDADTKERHKFVQDECTFTDGSAGRRTGEYILSLLEEKK
jgi:hypothetical protein